MKQILQNMSNGVTSLVEAPAPMTKSGHLLIQTQKTIISAGTERMLLKFGKASLLAKARQHPDKVKMVLGKIKTDGLAATIDAVRSKLDQPLPLGYCNCGTVIAIGPGVSRFKVGDRVISNGPHADVVRVPENLCAKIPEGVADERAVFTVLATIGLQGVRLAQPTLGECFVVTGLGLIGLLAVQLLKAHGCRVMGIDFDAAKCKLAESFGAEVVHLGAGEDPISAARSFSRSQGVDGVIVTASTKSSEPVRQGAEMCRKRGRVILVGVTGMELSRADFYEKEIRVQVSCSYGPGRHEKSYEEKGLDYPIGFVRWTEQRNFEAILDMMSEDRIKVEQLISHRFAFENAIDAYAVLNSEPSVLGILLEYPQQPQEQLMCREIALGPKPTYSKTDAVCAFIGAGNYASRMLIPAFKKSGAQLDTIVSSGGISSVYHGKKAEFSTASTDLDAMLADTQINTIAIATQHDSHAHFVTKALGAGKNVFVEKPLAITHEQLDDVVQAYENTSQSDDRPRLMIGFNRRFAPQIVKIKQLLAGVKEPKSFIMTINAGEIPADHWIQDNEAGGGRIIGEGCHFIDLMRFLADAPIDGFQAVCMGEHPGIENREDKAAITLSFEGGSFGTIHYLANGAAAFPKERIEVFCAGRVLQLDNFRKLTGYNCPGFKKMNLSRQDKGQDACAAAFVHSIQRGEPSPIPYEELIEVARVTIDVAKSLQQME